MEIVISESLGTIQQNGGWHRARRPPLGTSNKEQCCLCRHQCSTPQVEPPGDDDEINSPRPNGAVVDAAETFAAILGEEPENSGAYAGLIRCHLALDQLDQAEAMLTAAPPPVKLRPCRIRPKHTPRIPLSFQLQLGTNTDAGQQTPPPTPVR